MVAPPSGSSRDPSFHSRRCPPVSPAVTSVTPSPGPLSGFNLGDPVGRPHSVRPAPAPSVSASQRVLLHLAPCHPLSPLSLCGRKPSSLFGHHPFMANQVKEKCPPLFYFSRVSCSSGYPQTCCVNKGPFPPPPLNLYSAAFTSQVLGLEVCSTAPSFCGVRDWTKA